MKKNVQIRHVLASLYELSRLVREKSSTPEEDMEKARLLIQRALDFHLLTIFQFDYLEKKLLPVHTYGTPFNLVDAVNFRLGKGATGWCLQHKKPLMINNLKRKGEGERFFVNSFLSVPIIVNDQVVGTTVIGSSYKHQYRDGDRYLLEMMAPYLGSILLKTHFAIPKQVV